jgi:hypothetical protein
MLKHCHHVADWKGIKGITVFNSIIFSISFIDTARNNINI